ncbi:DNA repair protein RecN [Gallaecimonas pentaromativorans]|uniref:DNA repair protein RecN n=1 Tax=Gallaecimonas pentaromativorans TaxID=584787 RepID=A0A3N1PDJ0_9GAMM|nr:DNA repair protein RecN [Gallaecimonas pentaromativorans]ROQ25898.1 DNA replication and repair protein RecN [Gallaecimonas pentaromativorans]
MLVQLTVSNFAIVRFLELEFSRGLTAITGETGAGKSIAIDALGLCLGERSEASMVRPGADKCEVAARFDVSALPLAQAWLKDNELDDEQQCILRRTVTSEGRSRAFINGQPVPLSQLKQLGERLVNVHGQHAHHALLKPDHQLVLLDQYAGHKSLQEEVRSAWRAQKALRQELSELQSTEAQRDARRQLLEYQVQELDQFALEEGEFEKIEAEHHRQANAANLISESGQCLAVLCEDDQLNVSDMLRQVTDRLGRLQGDDAALEPIVATLFDAAALLDDASHELSRYQQRLEIDPESFAQLEERLSSAINLGRKHKIPTHELPALHQQLAEELKTLTDSDDRLAALEAEVAKAQQDYLACAQRLSQSRERHGKALAKAVQKVVRELALPHAQFDIDIAFDAQAPGAGNGLDKVQMLVSTNPGQPLAAMAKVASGGELSRIGLALQVLTSKQEQTPTLIFDEVDVGISGPTAAVVGKLLRSLGEHSQVMCVTHLPQVAGQGHQQLRVTKKTQKDSTETLMEALSGDQRIDELARLLGGDVITEATRANARELLAQ